jgi:hypothetical protein
MHIQGIVIVVIVFIMLLSIFFAVILPLSTEWPFSYKKEAQLAECQNGGDRLDSVCICTPGYIGDVCETLFAQLSSQSGHYFTNLSSDEFVLGKVISTWQPNFLTLVTTCSSDPEPNIAEFQIELDSVVIGTFTPLVNVQETYTFNITQTIDTNSDLIIKTASPVANLRLFDITATMEVRGARDCTWYDNQYFSGTDCDSLYAQWNFDSIEFSTTPSRNVLPGTLVQASWGATSMNIRCQGEGMGDLYDILIGNTKIGEIVSSLAAPVNVTVDIPEKVSGHIVLNAQAPSGGQFLDDIVVVVI